MASSLTKIDASEYLLEGSSLAATDLAAEGTAGQVLVSNGAGTKPSYVNNETGLVLLDTQTVVNEPTVDFVNLTSKYTLYYVVFYDLESVSNDQVFVMRTSGDNGGAFDAGASDYKYVNIANSTSGTAVDTEDATSASIGLTATGAGWGFGDQANETGDGHVYIFNPLGINNTKVSSDITYITASGNHGMARSAGSRTSATPVNAIQFLFGSGNIETGTFKLYGLA